MRRYCAAMRRFTITLLYPGALIAACSLVACGSQAADEPLLTAAMDDSSILSTAAHYRDSAAFVQVNDTPYRSALGDRSFINVYVSLPAFAAYATIEPDAKGTGVVLPEGAIIVREVLDGAGNVDKLTVMAKGPDGYNPALGDFWFAVTEPDGTPLVEDGAERVGIIEACHACHDERARDDFLFGIPAGNRRGIGEPGAPSPGAGSHLPPPSAPPPEPTPAPPGIECGNLRCELGEGCLSCPTDCGACDDGDRHRVSRSGWAGQE